VISACCAGRLRDTFRKRNFLATGRLSGYGPTNGVGDMITVHGIKNCDTCRKALKWLEAEGIEARFHDFRVDGLDGAALQRWLAAVGWETLLNRRGTTWRKLPDSDTQNVDATSAEALMLANPTLIKRPVFDLDGDYAVGFKAEQQDWIRSKTS